MEIASLPTPAWFREVAKARGTTITAVCRRAGIGSSSFYRWETDAGSPTLATIQKLLVAIHEFPVINQEEKNGVASGFGDG